MRMLNALVVLVLLIAPASAYAQSTTFDIPAHVSRVDGNAIIERDGADDALEPNVTLVQGDRVRAIGGRVEILFAGGTLLHLDRNTVIDFQREDFVRVMEGRVRWTIARDARGPLRVDTPAATLELDPGGDYRITVAPNGDAELAVLRGSGALLNDHGDTSLRAGERAVAAMGRAPSQAYYANAAALDDFDRWSDARRRDRATAESLRYLPNELQPYGAVFDTYGSWRTHPSLGYVWYPVAVPTWQPYSNGRWQTYPRYGATWIGSDPWDWPTHHFGRWGFSAGAWFWIPGRSWGPAWVSWATSPGYIGWSPLGWDDRPIININSYSRGSSAGYPWCGWTFIRERNFGGRWRPADIYIGAGINVVARNGFSPASASAITRHAQPRYGVPGGQKAVPRGTAVPREGLGSVPNARPRQVPAEPIRSVGSEPQSLGRPVRRPSGVDGAPAVREPQMSREPRAQEPREAMPRSGVRENPAGYPYSGAAPGVAPRARDREPSAPPREIEAAEPRRSEPRAAPPRWPEPQPQSQPQPPGSEPRMARPREPEPRPVEPRVERSRPYQPREVEQPRAERPRVSQPRDADEPRRTAQPRGGSAAGGGEDTRARQPERSRTPNPAPPPSAGASPRAQTPPARRRGGG